MLLGDLITWMYENLAGIKTNDSIVAFGKIMMHPALVENVNHVIGAFYSIHGQIYSEWKKEQNRFTWKIIIPPNTRAVVYMPASSIEKVREGSLPVSSIEGVHFLGSQPHRVVFEIGSGEYSFTSEF